MLDYPYEVNVSSRVEIAKIIYQQATQEQKEQLKPLLQQVIELQEQPQTNYEERYKVKHGLLKLILAMGRIFTKDSKDSKVFWEIAQEITNRHWEAYLSNLKGEAS